jgi:Holliday junction resolvasome RuvABC endonuclease subunit
MSIYIGIDPGKTGGVAWIGERTSHDEEDENFNHQKLDGNTDADVWDLLSNIYLDNNERGYAVIERVSSSPQMGVVSAFSFGRNFGFWIGCLTAAGIPYALVTPQKWQKAMGCMSKGDKNLLKAKAQQLYPNERITLATADALLIATYCKQHHHELF